jgi:ABC-type Na+ efflux pump permease subunit
MAGLKAVLRKEVKNFTGSDRSALLIYIVISVLWSFTLLSGGDGGIGGGLWLVFFSVIVAANFSGTVFISERVSGTLEVLITSGLSRDAVLFGKMLFVIVMTSIIGLLCAALAALWSVAVPDVELSRALGAYEAVLYFSVTCLNVSASAYFSVRMSNPRFLHFVNLFMTGVLVAIYTVVSGFIELHPYILVLAFLASGALFTFLARREFAGERIIRPIIF